MRSRIDYNIIQNSIAIIVLSICLFREIISYLIFLHPSEILFWYLSFKIGNDFVPILDFLGNHLGYGFFEIIVLIVSLILLVAIPKMRNYIIIRSILCHIILFILASTPNISNLIICILKQQYYIDMIQIFKLNSSTPKDIILIISTLYTLFSCLKYHIHYIKDVIFHIKTNKNNITQLKYKIIPSTLNLNIPNFHSR